MTEPRWWDFKKIPNSACPFGHLLREWVLNSGFSGHGFRKCPIADCGAQLYIYQVAGGGVLVVSCSVQEASELAKMQMSAADILMYFGVFEKRSAA